MASAPTRSPRSRRSSMTSSERAEHRAERDDDGLGVLEPVAAHEPTGVAAECGLESAAIRGIASSACSCLACIR